MSLSEKIRGDIKAAMLAREERRLSTLRMVQAEMLKREKEKVGTVLDDETVLGLLQVLAKQRRDSIEQFRAGQREDLAAKEQEELDFLMAYLPTPLSEAEIAGEIDKAIAASGATSVKDQGKVMGPLMKNLKATGRPFDGNAVQGIVRARLEQ